MFAFNTTSGSYIFRVCDEELAASFDDIEEFQSRLADVTEEQIINDFPDRGCTAEYDGIEIYLVDFFEGEYEGMGWDFWCDEL